MSSRAIRKVQKLREQQQQDSNLDESSDDDAPRPAKPKFNVFDLLKATDNDDDDDKNNDGDEKEGHQEHEEPHKEPVVQVESEPEPEPESEPAKPQKAKKTKKKKKNKSKQSQTKSPESDMKQQEGAGMDEIDRALKALGVTDGSSANPAFPTHSNLDIRLLETLDKLLSIQTKFLDPKTEMRKLFGDVTLENYDQDAGSGRRRNQEETIDLGRALSGRYCPASQGRSLKGIAPRQNPLFQGKGEWPLAISGGMSMEVNGSLPPGRTQYRICHSTGYKDVQRQFNMCVESMDPQRLIFHLQHNPYHASTLLQVSEIAKHQGDHAVAADLLERVLFNIGRSAHSTFGAQLKKGKARLDFRVKENRELWLTGWKYIADLGMKGTWRTAYEWGKLLLSLDDSDPYCISLLIDSLALRGREYAHFVELCVKATLKSNPSQMRDWNNLLNIQCSLVLAYVRLNQPRASRGQLNRAMSLFPWVFNRLAQELDLPHIPKQIWGAMPPDDGQKLFTELYVARVKDLWNTPEAVSLIVEVGDSLTDEIEPLEPNHAVSMVNVHVARHVILSDYPSLITHIPRKFMSLPLSASDPFPPNQLPIDLSDNADPREQGLSHYQHTHLQRARRQLQFYEADIEIKGSDVEEAIAACDTIHAEGTEWLFGKGLDNLVAWVARYGIDRGNWSGFVPDYWPLFQYLEALSMLPGDEGNEGREFHPEDLLPESFRDQCLNGIIADTLGEAGTAMLESELELWLLPL